MESKKTGDTEAAELAKRRVAAVGLKKIHRLLATFEKNDAANKRIAIVGFTLLVLAIAAVNISGSLFGEPPATEFSLRGTIEELKVSAENDGYSKITYSALVRLESGKTLRANISKESYASFKQGDLVELNCTVEGNRSRCDPLAKQKTNAP